MQDNGNIDFNSDIDKRAQFAADFVSTPYGNNVIERMAQLIYGKYKQMETAETAETAYALANKASGVREAMDLIVAEAQLISDGTLQQMNKQAEEEVDPSIAM